MAPADTANGVGMHQTYHALAVDLQTIVDQIDTHPRQQAAWRGRKGAMLVLVANLIQNNACHAAFHPTAGLVGLKESEHVGEKIA